MSSVEVIQASPVTIALGDPIIVIAGDDVETIQVGTAGPPGLPGPAGPIGPQGVPGVPGSKWYTGAGDPVGTSGVVSGDFYLDTTDGQVWQLVGSTWTLRADITGDTGAVGPQGPQGVVGPQGAVGPQGNPGPTGPQGPQGVPGAIPEAPSDGTLYGRKNAAWAAVLAGGEVRYDIAQVLTAIQQQQARLNVYAAPFDAMAYNGMQVNGGMDVSQERGNNAVTLTNNALNYIIDGWMGVYSSATMSLAGGAQAPVGAPFGLGHPNCLTLTTNTGAALGANDYVTIGQYIEGWRVVRLNFGHAAAGSITVSFWAQASIAGNFGVVAQNGGNNRSYVTMLAINTPATWEYKTVTIPGDVAGTWLKTNGIGLAIWLCFGVGATYQTVTPNAWQAGTVYGTSATTNFCASNSNVVRVTGFRVVPGNEAPSAARSPYIMRPFDQELKLCRRYFETSFDYGVPLGNPGYSANDAGIWCVMTGSASVGVLGVPFPYLEEKRVNPTGIIYDGAGNPGKVSTINTGGIVTNNVAPNLISFLSTRRALVRTYNDGSVGFIAHYRADARL
jgi:hypothetical protein